MANRFPPLSWLRAFEASARHLSFTLAATELNLTQAAISKQVRLLEQQLREPLFQRKARSLVLTRVGAAYLPKVQDAFKRLSEGTEEVFGNRRSEMLTVRSLTGFSVNWIAPRLKRFFARYPDVSLRLVSSLWREDFDQERFDLDIRYGSDSWPSMRCDQLTWEMLEPLCAPDIAKSLKTPADLKGHQLLHVLGYEEGWAVWLKAAGETGINAGDGQHFDTSLMAFEVAASGVGVALGRSSMASVEIASGRLVQPFDLAVPIREAFHLVSPVHGREHPDAAAFRNWILEEAHAARDES